ncbi:IucA/IucC family protein [Pseudomonas sp. KNUC1026]|uniref:IucA/IucC family protein n=1 Tax=Pseudomonas sp. KNUC1026 TaxID=2893890 RepID=UPI001F33518E|nr:IucA/IucC family protein [Pseudomonas sp. KNUC1026]UFH51607.1 IucA/IucC family siderophore biosynthesis protein [Pseudomonas sp. KNUC1026]
MAEPAEPCTRASVSQVVSELAATHALLNCLIKEFALPEQRLSYAWPAHVRGMAPGGYLRALRGGGLPLVISLPEGRQLFVLVDRQDPLGSQRYLGDVYTRVGDGAWACPTFTDLATQLLGACEHMAGARNQELHAQVAQSQQVTAAIIAHALANGRPAPLRDYLASEQGLHFGHPNHPAPKARQWPEHLGQNAYGPEFGTQVRLHALEVPRDGLAIRANGLSQAEALNGFADQRQAAAGRAVIYLHPVQAQLFMADARVAALLDSGQVVDLGEQGALASPTASMRTWYIEGHKYFLKGSLNVRITNCVRKNAWYELDSALLIDRLFQRLQAEQPASLGGAALVREPASLSWAPAGANADDALWFREQTGAILRENFCRQAHPGSCLMAGTLFARDLQLRPLVQTFLQGSGGQPASDAQLLGWFERYQALLLRPVLALFFNHGVVMEPHLQNAVLVHDNGQPAQLLLRDFEGVKLTAELGVQYLDADVPERVRQSLTYPREQGFKRISYCLFVNHLAEAVLALSWDRPELATAMWACVHRQLAEIRDELQRPAPELDALLAGEPIACKTNLKVRLAAQADRHAAYVQLPSPWAGRVAP